MSWIPGVTLAVLLLGAITWWAIRHEVPRLNRRGRELSANERLLDWRQARLDEAYVLWEQYFELLHTNQRQEASRVRQQIEAIHCAVKDSWKD